MQPGLVFLTIKRDGLMQRKRGAGSVLYHDVIRKKKKITLGDSRQPGCIRPLALVHVTVLPQERDYKGKVAKKETLAFSITSDL